MISHSFYISCGGGSPLADALLSAVKMALNELKVKKDVGSCVIVLITDGRVNVPLCISRGEKFDAEHLPSIDGRPTKEYLQDEVLHCAQMLPKLGLDLVVIDSEDKFVGTGIARLLVQKLKEHTFILIPEMCEQTTSQILLRSINK